MPLAFITGGTLNIFENWILYERNVKVYKRMCSFMALKSVKFKEALKRLVYISNFFN